MGYRPSDKEIDSEHRAARRRHDEAHRALCVEAVTEWNRLMERRHKPPWSPALGVAIAAGFYFLDVWCPGCAQLKQVDLRKLDRHPQTTLFSLIPSLSCRNCQPHPPFARIKSLSVARWESPNAPVSLPSRRT
jgi:hypothetical protein